MTFAFRLATRLMTGLLAAALFGVAAWAASETIPYRIDPSSSVVRFQWKLGETPMQGHIPIGRARIALNFHDLGRSAASIELDASRAEAGVPFATQAMRGPEVLNAARFPMIRFQSDSFRRTSPSTADVHGKLTIQGITRPVVLKAQLTRPRGSAPDDFGNLGIRLRGVISRSAFGASGWADRVADDLALDIDVHVLEAR